jgi:hypothetical protein
MNRRSFWSFAALAPVAMTLRAQEGAPGQSYVDYEIERFLEQDKTRPPPQGGILFIGSSIFREWADLEKQMAPLPVFNRAFGGSRTWEVLHYADKVAARLSETRIFYVSINKAPEKQHLWNVVDQANSRVREYTKGDRRLGFIDVNPVLFDAAGKPRLELYREDQLHFHPPAYAEFARIIRPVVEKAWGEASARSLVK